MNAHFRHAGPDRRDVARVAEGQPVDPHGDLGPRLAIRQIGEPIIEFIGPFDAQHRRTVNYGLHPVNGDPMNERVDRLAKAAISTKPL
jgi:hypothetical protein